MLTNPRSDRIKRVSALVGRSFRRRTGLILVEGPQAVRELLVHKPDTVRDVYIDPTRASGLVRLAEEATRWVHEVSSEVAEAISPDGQGVAAVATVNAVLAGPPKASEPLASVASDALAVGGEPKAVPPQARGKTTSDHIRGCEGSIPLAVMLPETQDPGNAGTIIRSAAAFGAMAVFLGEGSVDPTNPKVIRASAGAIFHLPIYRLNLDEAREVFAGGVAQVLGTSGSAGSVNLDRLILSSLTAREDSVTAHSPALRGLRGPHIWVLGNEARGLSTGDQELCDVLVSIPICERVESLNAAAAAAVCLHASHMVAFTDGT